MVNSGKDSDKKVHPILVDSTGKQYVIIDGTVTVIQPTAANLKATVTQAAKDRTVTNAVAANLKSEVTQAAKDRTITGTATVTQAAKDRTITDLKPDGTNQMPSGDDKTRPIYVKIADGAEVAIIETDDDDIAKDQKTLTVINLNYTWDAANDKWVRSTPSVGTIFKWDIIHGGALRAITGTWVEGGVTTAHFLGKFIWNSSADQNDKCAIGSFLAPTSGDYTIYLLGYREGSGGIVHVLINGVDETQLDLYGATHGNYIFSGTLSGLTAGLKTLGFVISSKNASSGGYNCKFQSCIIKKA